MEKRRRTMYGKNNEGILKVDANTTLMLRFNNGNMTKDSSKNNVTVSKIGSPTLVEGIDGTAMQSTHLTNGLSMDRSVFADLITSGNFTAECFFKYTTGNQSMLFGLDSGDVNGCYLLMWNAASAKYIVWGGYGTETNNQSLFEIKPVSANVWHHVAVTCQSKYCRLFIDGVMIASRSSMSLNTPNVPFTVGYRNSNNAATNDVIIDELRLSNIARYTADFTPPSK